MLRFVILLVLLSTVPLRVAFSFSCEEERAEAIKLFAENSCKNEPCYEGLGERWCIGYSSVEVRKYDEVMDEVTCLASWTYDAWDPVNTPPSYPPTHDSGSYIVDSRVPLCSKKRLQLPQSPPPGRGSGRGGGGGPPGSCSISGSIVDVETQSLTESILVSGLSMPLIYHSAFQDGHKRDFRIRYEISGDLPREYIQSYSVELSRGGSVVDTSSFVNNLPNQHYEYIWNGLDSTGAIPVISAEFELAVNESSPSGVFKHIFPVNLVHWDAKEIGTAGWLPADLKRYDVVTKRLYSATGGAQRVTARAFGVSQLYVPDPSGKNIYVFDLNGRHLLTKSGMTGSDVYLFSYNSTGQLETITESFGRVTTFDRDIAGQLVSITAPNGQVTSIGLDVNGYISSISNENSENFSISYFGVGGLMASFQKPNGEISTFDFDSDGLLIKDTHSGGYFFDLISNLNSTYSYDISVVTGLGRTLQMQTTTDSNGGVSRSTTSPSGIIDSKSYALLSGSSARNDDEFGSSSSILSIDDQRFGADVRFPQSETHAFYGGTSRSISRTQDITLSDPNDPFSISSWQTTTQLSGENTTTTLNYDPLTKKFTSSTYMGKTAEWTIDNYERTISTKQGNLEQVDLGYTNEHLTSVTQGTRVTSLAYNSLGLLETMTNPLSQATSYVYDSANRVASKIFPDSRVIGFSYDGVGNLTGVTPPGRPLHSFFINGHGLVGTYAPPVLTGVSVVNTTYSYNLDKQMTSVVRPDGGFINYNYNATTGILENYETPEGFYTQYMDTVVELPNYIETPAGVSTQVGYMARNPVSFTNNVSGNSAGSYAPTFGTSNRMESDTVTGPTGTTSTISYLYNDDEDLRKAGDVNISYNVPNGQLTGTSMGSGSTGFTDSYTYNTFGEVTGYQAKRGTTVIYDLTLSRDGMGRINGKTQIVNSVTDDYDYTFDSTGRLTQVQKNSAVSANYSYDSNSNRTGGNVGSQPTTATYDDQDRLLTYNTYSFTYNANGDLQSKTNSVTSTTTQYNYDVFGNLRQVTLPTGTVIDYEVDALNRRIGKRVNGVLQKRWIYMDQYRIAAEANAAGAITKRFVYGSKTNIPDYMIASGVKYRIISDHLGSPRLVVKQSDGTVIQRMDHDEFGRVIADTNPGYLPFGFAGGLYDHQTSLVRFGARDYDPEVGRWTSKDPIRFEGEDTNLFGYVLSDPVNWVDTEGLKPSGGAVTANPSWPAGGGIAVGVAIEVCSPKPAKKKENCQKVFDDTLSSCLAKGDKPAKCVSDAGIAYRACVERANAN